MIRAAMFVAALALAGCGKVASFPTSPPPPAAEAAVAPGEACGLTIEFGSYAMGIDRGALTAIDAILAGDAGVAGVDRKPWGREGELTLCVRTRSAGDAARLFAAVQPLVPAKPRGPVSVTSAAGEKFSRPRE